MDWHTHSVPRYRVEERSPALTTLIVGFADTLGYCRSLLAIHTSRLIGERRRAELVMIEQATETIIRRRQAGPDTFSFAKNGNYL